MTTLGRYIFGGCTSLTNIEIRGGVKEIESGMFQDCVNLTNVEILDGVESIGYDVFLNCTNLQRLKISASVILAIGCYVSYKRTY